jgi:hypothetical protein
MCSVLTQSWSGDAADLEQQMRKRKVFLSVFVVGTLALAPVAANADDSETARQSFRKFCSSWMTKLEKREVYNAKQLSFVRKEGRVVGEYAGYARKPTSCEIKATGVPASPFIGKLTYEERLYRKSGASPTGARSSEPEVVGATHVLEIFRYDGDDWVY